MNKTFIFGHKKPDSDSVMAAISLSYLKNKLGDTTEARILGPVNKETEYALKYFGLETPEYLNDVKLQIKDVGYHKSFMIHENDCIFDGYQMMLKEGLTGLPVAKENGDFLGLITLKDLSHTLINENVEELLTSYNNILHVLDGKAVIRIDDEIAGKLLVAAYHSSTFIDNVTLTPETILIVGDRRSIIDHAINNDIKLLIITGGNKLTEEQMENAKKMNVNVIETEKDSYHVANLISLTNYVKTMIKAYNPTKFDENDFVSTVNEVNSKLRHTNYPIVDKNNKCLGLLRITDLASKDPKKCILVDHNEKLQSADGIDEADILEIVDHHNLGSITTPAPINFRNMAVGSTCTIIYTLYKEKGIEIPKEIAGAILSGILSDTLILKSPTKTAMDEAAVKELSKIAGVEYEVYGLDMLKAGTSIEGMSEEDILYNDFKPYTVNESKFGVGQFFTMNFDEIKKNMDKFVAVLDREAEANGYNLLALYITDIIENGSYVLYNTKAQNLMELIYEDKEVEQGMFIEKCVSRKKNVVPLVMDVFED